MSTPSQQLTTADTDADRTTRAVEARTTPQASVTSATPDDVRLAADEPEPSEEAIDEAVEMTFPASDPPSWMSS